MPKLNQILAIEKGEKTKSHKAITELHHKYEKPDLYEGRSRTYETTVEGGEELPPERQVVQLKADMILKKFEEALAPLWDLTATRDFTNSRAAHADVVLDGKVLIAQAPVSFLLFVEDQLNNVETFITKMPTLDPTQEWKYNKDTLQFNTDPTYQNRTKKVMRNHVKAKATDKHPEQVEVYHEDQVIGKFQTIRYSGAMSTAQKEKLLDRVRKLKNAVLFAREQANAVEVEKKEVARALFGYIFE